MISTEYTELGLEYKNYNDVSINGINVHYFRKINKNSNLKFVLYILPMLLVLQMKY